MTKKTKKKFAKDGVRTHAHIREVDLKSKLSISISGLSSMAARSENGIL